MPLSRRSAWSCLLPFYLTAFLATSPAQTPKSTTQSPAPIERRPAALPEAPQPTPTAAETRSDQAWARLSRQASHGDGTELRVQALGLPVRCQLDDVTPGELLCVERSRGWLTDAFFPRQQFHIPRRDIREIREGGRGESTTIGFLVGAGIGTGLAVTNAKAGQAVQEAALTAALVTVIGTWIGHGLPTRGHVVYREP